MRSRDLIPLCAIVLAACQASSDSSSTKPGAKPAASRKTELFGLRPAPIVLAQGTELPLRLETSLSSETSHAGDLVVARLASDVKSAERVLLKEGSELRGKVTVATPSGRVKGRARLAFLLDRVVVNGSERELATRPVDITAESAKKRDAAIIGGAAAGGAIIGAITGGGKGAAIGTATGGAAGTGVVLATKGHEVELPAGTGLRVRVEKDARI